MESRTQGSRPRTQKNFEAKDGPSRGQEPRTQTQVFSEKKRSSKFFSGYLKKKKVFKHFFQAKRSSKFFFRRSLLEETKKRSLQIFRKVSSVFPRNFNGSKIVLSSSQGQGNFRGLEALRPRTSKCVLEDVLEAKDVLEDSTSVGDSQINNFRFKCSVFKFCFTNFNSFVVTCIRVQNLNLWKLLEIIELRRSKSRFYNSKSQGF